MEKTRLKQEAQILSPCSSGRRSSATNSPDFEFWMVRNPSFPTTNLVSADELFVNGVLLPLHLHPPHHSESDPPDDAEPPIPTSDQDPPVQNSGPGPELTAVTHESTTGFTASKRWKDMLFKKGSSSSSSSHDKKAHEDKDNNKEKKKERKSSQSRTSSAELNINIWPFSRSRSAGNNGTRPKLSSGAPATRKVSSAPCSRSNSAGESKSRKWPSSPSRAGVHLGRSSPVWQVRRGGSGLKPSEPVVRNAEKGVKKEVPEIRRSKIPTVPAVSSAAGGGGGGGTAKARVLNLNVPTCISYRSHLSCKSGENNPISVATGGVGGGNGGGGGAHSGGGGGNLFGLRNLFTKKVY